MKTFSTFQFHSSKSLLWLIGFFLLVMVAGCSSKDSAISSLGKKGITISADSLSFFSSTGDLATVKLLLDAGVECECQR